MCISSLHCAVEQQDIHGAYRLVASQASDHARIVEALTSNVNHETLLFCSVALGLASKIHDATAIITPKLLKTLLK